MYEYCHKNLLKYGLKLRATAALRDALKIVLESASDSDLAEYST
jgi:hypothetical protein